MKGRTAIADRARRDEGGSVIILVIAILVAVGILVGALARLATPLFAQAEVTRNLNDAGAAVDAGIDYGIQTIHAGLLANAGQCQPPPQPPQSLNNPPYNPPSVNGLVPTVTCQTTSSIFGVSQVVLTSSLPAGSGSRIVSARAVVQANIFYGATTIMSWRVCQDGPSC